MLKRLRVQGFKSLYDIEPSELQVIERITDKVIRATIDGIETIINVEFQASHEEALPTRLLTYHALLRQSHAPMPVRSMVVYLMHEPPPGGVPCAASCWC